MIEHGIRNRDLKHAQIGYDLENDKAVKQCEQKLLNAKRKDKFKREQDLAFHSVCQERGPVDLTLDEDGYLKFEEFLRIFSMVVALEIRVLRLLDNQFKPERLIALQNQDHKHFAETVATFLKLQTFIKAKIGHLVAEHLKLGHEVYERSLKHF